MKKTFALLLCVGIAALQFAGAASVFFAGQSTLAIAATTTPTSAPGGGTTTPTSATGGGGGSMELPNPIGYRDICQLLNAVMNLVVELAAIVAVIMIIWVGLRFVRAQGNEKAISEAKVAFMNTILGTAILLGASVIAKVIVNTILSVTKATGTTSSCS